MNSDSLPTASSSRPTDDAEVLSQRGLNQGETVPEMPSGETLVAGHMGRKAPKDSDNGGRSQFGPRPNMAPET